MYQPLAAVDPISCEPLWHARGWKRDRRGIGRRSQSTFRRASGPRRLRAGRRCYAVRRRRTVFVRFGGTDAQFGLGGIQTTAGMQPCMLAREACPCSRGGKHLPDRLCVEGEPPKSHVAIRLALDHLTDRVDLVGGELRRDALRATRTIVETSDCLDSQLA